MIEDHVSETVLKAAFTVHSELGPGLLEKVYQMCLAHELRKYGMLVEVEKVIPVTYDGLVFEQGYRIDIMAQEELVMRMTG